MSNLRIKNKRLKAELESLRNTPVYTEVNANGFIAYNRDFAVLKSSTLFAKNHPMVEKGLDEEIKDYLIMQLIPNLKEHAKFEIKPTKCSDTVSCNIRLDVLKRCEI